MLCLYVSRPRHCPSGKQIYQSKHLLISPSSFVVLRFVLTSGAAFSVVVSVMCDVRLCDVTLDVIGSGVIVDVVDVVGRVGGGGGAGTDVAHVEDGHGYVGVRIAGAGDRGLDSRFFLQTPREAALQFSQDEQWNKFPRLWRSSVIASR